MIPIQIASIESNPERELILSLYTNHYRLLKHQIHQITGDWDKSDDLVQDTIVRLIPKAGLLLTLSEPQQLVYAVKTAKSVALNFIRRQSVRNRRRYYPEESEWESFPAQDDPIEPYIENDTFRSSISALSERDQDLIYFYYVLEYDKKELCRLLNISPKSINQTLSRARKRASLLRKGDAEHGEA